jgi:hypothetical protein
VLRLLQTPSNLSPYATHPRGIDLPQTLCLELDNSNHFIGLARSSEPTPYCLILPHTTNRDNPTLSAIQSAQLASPPHRAQECANLRRNPRFLLRNRTAENRPFSSSDSIRPSGALRVWLEAPGRSPAFGGDSTVCISPPKTTRWPSPLMSGRASEQLAPCFFSPKHFRCEARPGSNLPESSFASSRRDHPPGVVSVLRPCSRYSPMLVYDVLRNDKLIACGHTVKGNTDEIVWRARDIVADDVLPSSKPPREKK